MPAVTHLRCARDGPYSIEIGGVLGADGPALARRLLTVHRDGSWEVDDARCALRSDTDRRAADGAAARSGAQSNASPAVRLPELVVAPALYDAHVHLHPDLALGDYLAYGVGRVRDLGSRIEDAPAGGDCADPVPELVRGGPMLDRPGPPRLLIAATWDDADQLPALLEAAAARGAAWVKLYEAFPVQLFAPTVARAHALGLRVAVHPAPGDYRAAVDAGVDELEHLACLVPPGPRGTHALLARWAGRRPGERWPELPAGTAVCPTLLVQHDLVAEAGRGWRFDGHDPRMADFWRASAIARRPWNAEQLAAGEAALSALREALRELDRSDVRWLVGSDTPNPGLRPGESLWREMNLLVDAGLDRSRVFRASAVAPDMAVAGSHPLVFLPPAALDGRPFPTTPPPAILLHGCLYRPEECP